MKGRLFFFWIPEISSWLKSSVPTGYHVSGPFSSNISADLAKVVSDKNDSPRFLGERGLWTQQVVMLLISETLLMALKRKQ